MLFQPIKLQIFCILTIKTLERCQWGRSVVFIVNFEHISDFCQRSLLSNVNKYMLTGQCFCKVKSLVSKYTYLIHFTLPSCYIYYGKWRVVCKNVFVSQMSTLFSCPNVVFVLLKSWIVEISIHIIITFRSRSLE